MDADTVYATSNAINSFARPARRSRWNIKQWLAGHVAHLMRRERPPSHIYIYIHTRRRVAKTGAEFVVSMATAAAKVAGRRSGRAVKRRASIDEKKIKIKINKNTNGSGGSISRMNGPQSATEAVTQK